MSGAARLPLVTLKAAITLDGRMATRGGSSRWITCEASRRQGHRMRAASDAIMVGVGTVLADDPELTVRMVRGRDPLRVILDTRLRTPVTSRVVTTARETPTLIFHGARAPAIRRRRLEAAGVELRQIRALKAGGLNLRAALMALARMGVSQLLVEGGPKLHGALIDHRLADRAAIFIAPTILADARGLPLADGRKKHSMDQAWRLKGVRRRAFGDDTLITGSFES